MRLPPAQPEQRPSEAHEIVLFDPRARRERVTGTRHQHHRLVEQEDCLEVGGDGLGAGPGDDPELHHSVEQQRHDPLVVACPDNALHPWVDPHEGAQGGTHQAARQRRERSESDPPVLPDLRLPRRLEALAEDLQRPPRERQEALAERSQCDAPAVGEEGAAHLLFQRLDASADGGLPDAQVDGSARKTALPGDAIEGGQLFPVHVHPIDDVDANYNVHPR